MIIHLPLSINVHFSAALTLEPNEMKLTLTVLVTTIDALGHFETG